MKKYLLRLLMLAAILTATFTVLITAYAFRAQEHAMDTMMRSYVMDLSNSLASSMWGEDCSMDHTDTETCLHCTHSHIRDFQLMSVFPASNDGNAGGILVQRKDGRLLAASPGATKLLASFRPENIPLDIPMEMRDVEGNRFYVLVRECSDEKYVLIAVSRTWLLGPVLGVWRFWMTSALLTSLAVLAGILMLWRYLVAPLHRILESIRNMQWGRDCPRMPTQPVLHEISALSDAIEELAGDAIVREELRTRYVSDMVRRQEGFRKSLARELHDGPLQGVVAVIKRIQLAQDPVSSRREENLKTAENIAQNAAGEIREYCDALSPSWVKLGAVSAIMENADRLSQAFEIQVAVRNADEVEAFYDLPEEHVLALVRILQEAVSNSARHGGASRVEVVLETGEEATLHFRIQDNGTGFPAPPRMEDMAFESLLATGHRGLANINERVRLLRGTMQLQSEPGRGCLIDIYFPGVSFLPERWIDDAP